MRILIIDGGRQGQSIADRLLAKNGYRMMFRTADHQISFVEESAELCQLLEERFGGPVYQGDGTKQEVLQQAMLETVDVAIAASGDDGRNVLIALKAKELGIDQVIAIVEDPDCIDRLQEDGIAAICPLLATAETVQNLLDRPDLAQPLKLGAGQANLLGVSVQKTAKVIGKRIHELALPYECVIAAVIHGDSFVVPKGDTQIKPGHYIIMVGPSDVVAEAAKVFR